MSSFTVLFNSYKNLLSTKAFEDKKESFVTSETKETESPATTNNTPPTYTVSSSDVQSATKKIFNIAVNQNKATLKKLQFYETISTYFIHTDTDEKQQPRPETKDNNNKTKTKNDTNPNRVSCTSLLREIGWDLLTELFLLSNKDHRFELFLHGICKDISPRELSIMFSEVFCHPMLSITATHHHYQLHTMQNHYQLHTDEDSEQQKQMLLNLNISNQQINMDRSDAILSFHKNINYIKTQTLFIHCIIILFNRLTSKSTTKHSINHFYRSLIPTAILHFQTLSKELSYQFYLHNITQYHNHNHGHHTAAAHCMSSDCVKALDATKKERQAWLANSKKEYEIYLETIYKLFALMVNNHCNLRDLRVNEIKDEVVDVQELIKCFKPRKADEEEENKEERLLKSININTLWLARYGFGVLSGVYWWYNVFYNEDFENDGDVNNDSLAILQNLKKPGYNIFLNDHVDALKRELLVKLCHNVGMNGNVLFGIREYLRLLENKLEAEKPWHLNSDQMSNISGSKSNPSTPTPQLQPMSSIGHPDLNTIVEEQEDSDDGGGMVDIAYKMDDGSNDNNDEEAAEAECEDKTAVINAKETETETAAETEDNNELDLEVIMNGTAPTTKDVELEDDINVNLNLNGWEDELPGPADDDVDFGEIDPSRLKKMQETQQLVDELQDWNEFIDFFGVACYYHSLWVLLQSDDCTENNGVIFKKHSKHVWKCITLMFEQLTTLPAGIEFGEFILNQSYPRNMSNKNKKLDLNKLLNAAQFHQQGLWQLVQSLTSQLKGISDRALHQKLWQFIVHLINSADLKTRFQCIVSTALQCPIPVVQSLMFTELKNQIFDNWNIELKVVDLAVKVDGLEEEEDNGSDDDDDDGMAAVEGTLNPFCSREVVMVLVQRLGKELQNMSLQTINSELDSLNACLNLCRFILMKDKNTNYTQIYDEDCPLKHVVQSLFDEMTSTAQQDTEQQKQTKGKNQMNEIEDFQRQMMKNQFLVSLDLVKRIQEMYHK